MCSSTSEVPVATTTNTSKFQNTEFMKGMVEFLRVDLQHLFDEQGIDRSKYDDVVQFVDPITRYNTLTGYLFNIQMLRYVFQPHFTLHDARQTGDWEVTTRWTMRMTFTPVQYTPLARVWTPELIFTGTSIMGINPKTGKFNRHIDTWDAIQNQEYFSLEGFAHVFQQLGSVYQTPQLETPQYMVLRKTKDYEIRRYEAFLVAEAPMTLPAKKEEQDKGVGAFQALAQYIFGGNQQGERMSMTTPVFTDGQGLMRFTLPASYQDPSALPVPINDAIVTKALPGGIFGAVTFNGVADKKAAEEKLAQLTASLVRDGYKFNADLWQLARYNDPSTRPYFRRNEVLLPVDNFDLWG